MNEALTTHAASQLVPASYAEKAMASLMQLHSELMDEKEKRVELFRRLMEREQSLAELKMYVKMLEEKVAAPLAAAPPSRREVDDGPRHQVAAAPRRAPRVAPVPPQIPSRPRVDGWKTW